jgi:hypothetical protein
MSPVLLGHLMPCWGYLYDRFATAEGQFLLTLPQLGNFFADIKDPAN